MDLSPRLSTTVLMDDIDRELIGLLCTKIGMLLEDHGTSALTIGSQSVEQQRATLDNSAVASAKIAKLVAAAQSIAE